jgi:hypothetical protein
LPDRRSKGLPITTAIGIAPIEDVKGDVSGGLELQLAEGVGFLPPGIDDVDGLLKQCRVPAVIAAFSPLGSMTSIEPVA